MALYWRKNMFDVIGFETLNILASENYTFASRPPLQVCLKTKTGNKTDTIYFITVHLKAISDLDSYNRRKAASALLKSYVESALKGKKYIILGDWNDDLDASTYQLAETPFKNFLDAKYTFPSKELTDAGKSSYAFNTNMIDHIMNSKTLDSFYVKGSARVFDNAATYAVNFSNTTSDHWPVYAFYDWKKLTTLNIPIGNESYERLAEVKVWPNPFSNDITIQLGAPEFMVRLFDMKGSLVYEEDITQNEKTINTDGLSSGIYVISVNQNGQTFRTKMIK
jgi:hypothetical protein